MKQETQESFNARYLSYEHIAKTFISNQHYNELLKNNHTLLMGPRGSGKTTLLKMLTPACQYYLKNNRRGHKEIGFTAIYIPTDIQWNKQIEVFSKDIDFPDKIKGVFPQFLVTTNILISLINTFIQIFETQNLNDTDENIFEKEVKLSQAIIGYWQIERPVAPTLMSIKQALYNRLTFGNTLLKRIKYGDYDVNAALPDFFYHEYLDLVTVACSEYESVFEIKLIDQKKWAFCFDELEISPDWLQKDLLIKARSVDQRFIFKLTTSPIVSFVDKVDNEISSLQAREDEDFKIIRTWNYDYACLKNWNIFSDKLITQKIQRHFVDLELKPLNIFGDDSDIRNLMKNFPKPKTSFKSKNQESLYEEGNYYWSLFKELATIDVSFKKFLEAKNINSRNPLANNPSQMDQVFRKTKELVLYRFHFKKAENQKRGRKNPALNYGIPAIYELCDGNPRFLISLIDALLPSINNGKIPINQQASVISHYSERYLALLASHPDSTKELSAGKYLNLSTLIERIGLYFFDKLIYEDFRMTALSTFTVDKQVPEIIIELIVLGIHLGAFIYLDPKKALSKEGIVGVKLRLSYLLHPHFNLPKREYDNVNLSTILKYYSKSTNSNQLKILV